MMVLQKKLLEKMGVTGRATHYVVSRVSRKTRHSFLRIGNPT